jgi:biopolymer transport protein ExbD
MPRHDVPAAHARVPNLAPLVDVVMVILIFFMLGTTFAVSEGALPTQLPSQVGPGGGASIAIVPAVRIVVYHEPRGDGYRIVVMDHRLEHNSFEALADFMKAKRSAGADPTAPVLIAADGTVQYQHVISAMDACVRAGFSNIQFSVAAGALHAATDPRPTS